MPTPLAPKRIPSKNATFKFKAREPIGEETVKAIATLDEIPLYDNKEDNTLDPRNQAEILKQIQTIVMSLETGKWAEYQLKINVVQ